MLYWKHRMAQWLLFGTETITWKNFVVVVHFRKLKFLKKECFFLANKGVGVGSSLDIWPSRKGLLQNMYLLYLSYHKCNPMTTVVDGSTFLKIFKTITWEKIK